MKKFLWVAGSILLGLFACKPEVTTSGPDIDFGIYEILDPAQLPPSLTQRIQELQVQVFDPPQYPLAGHTLQHGLEWREALSAIGAGEGIRMAETKAPEHEGEETYNVVALRNPATLNASDIREAIGESDRVVIRMTRQGAIKWADMTERNQGRTVAFLLEGLVYNMPLVAAPIRTGEALITGLDAAEAERIAAVLNGNEGQ